MRRLVTNGSALVSAVAAITLGALAWSSLGWEMSVDAPLLAYAAVAIDQWGFAPYRDIFDFNTPGAYLANIAIGRVFGFSELGFRLGDLALLAVLLGTTLHALRSFGWRTAVTAALCFGHLYLGFGPVMSLQREYLLLIPVAVALTLAMDGPVRPGRWAMIGALLGVAATIKPQSALLMPVFAASAHWRASEDTSRERVNAALGFALGVGTPLVAAVIWLWVTGGLDAFRDMATHYWPLYNELTGARPHRIVQGGELWIYRLQRFALSRDVRHVLLVAAVAGAMAALRRTRADTAVRQRIWLMIGVAVALQLYPLAAGKYWGYHWLPSFYGASLLAALCFAPAQDDAPLPRDFAPAMLIVMLTALTPGFLNDLRMMRNIASASDPSATAIARVLQARLREGDRVQPLDWTGGAVHALFKTQARLATPFLYDFYLYHHVSTPYVQSLRRRLMASITEARPAFVITADQQRRFEGPDTTYQFTELTDFLRRDYRAVVANDRFVIYERNDR